MLDAYLNTISVILLLLGAAFLSAKLAHGYRRKSRGDRVCLGALLVVAALSGASYTRMGDLHQYGPFGRHVYHYHDLFHYRFGAKYYREFGYYKMYEATVVALDELSRESLAVPYILEVRWLKDPSTTQTVPQSLERRAETKARFSVARWKEFKDDIVTMLWLGWDVGWWRGILIDLGFNPPPSWCVLMSPLADIIPFTPSTMELIPLIDIVLVWGVGGWLIARAFGLYGLCAYIIVLGNNWLSSYLWTGGSFCRNVWLFSLAAGVASLKRHRFKTAGVLLGAAVSLRLFPAFYLFGAVLPLTVAAYREPAWRRRWLELVVPAVATIAVLVGLSLLMYGVGYWQDFFAKLTNHESTYFPTHLGFRKLVTAPAAVPGQDFWWAVGLKRFMAWQAVLESYYQAHAVAFVTVKYVTLGVAATLCLWLEPFVAAVVFGSLSVFMFSMTANYYYAFLALFPPVLFAHRTCQAGGVRLIASARPSAPASEPGRGVSDAQSGDAAAAVARGDSSPPATVTDVLRVAGSFAVLVVVVLCAMKHPDIIEHNGYINLTLFVFFWVVLLLLAFDQIAPRWRAWSPAITRVLSRSTSAGASPALPQGGQAEKQPDQSSASAGS